MAFENVVHSCFGEHLNPNYKVYIDEFFGKINDLKRTITPKIHCVLFHIIDFCELKNRVLGLYSEQASEQIHHIFNFHSQKFITKSSAPDYDKQLLRSVCSLN